MVIKPRFEFRFRHADVNLRVVAFPGSKTFAWYIVDVVKHWLSNGQLFLFLQLHPALLAFSLFKTFLLCPLIMLAMLFMQL